MTTSPTDSLAALELIGSGRAFQDQLCAMLEDSQMFGDLEWPEIQALAGYMQAYRADRGTTLFREGDGGSYLCLVVKGSVDICKEDRARETKVVATVGSGKTLGEMAMVDGEPRSATAVAAAPTTLAVLTRENFTRLTQEKPGLAAKVLLKVARLLSQRLRLTSGVLVDYLEP